VSEIRSALTRQLPSNIFVQFLGGPDEIRKGPLGQILAAILWVTLVVGPIALLLLLQIQFLPYHSRWVTWINRTALVVDLGLIWWLWGNILHSSADYLKAGSWRSSVKTSIAVLLSVCIILFACAIATIPGEWQEDHLSCPAASNSLRKRIFAGRVDNTTRRRTSLFSNTLVLPGFNIYEALKIDDPKKVGWKQHLVDLRGRDLKGAVLEGAVLPRADLTGAQIQGALLTLAQLRGASLDDAQLQGAPLKGAQLQGASLNGAQLQGADLADAFLWRADLEDSVLENIFDRNGTIHWGPIERGNPPRPWTGATYAALRQSMEQEVPEGSLRSFALSQVAILDCERKDDTLASCNPSDAPPDAVKQWKKMIEAASIGPNPYTKALAAILGDLVCSDEADLIYVLRGLLNSDRFGDTGREMPTLAKRITSAECPLSTALTDGDKYDIAAASDKLAKSP
jgi:uncharacterized protein YjbI with pentapeptide repeats